MLPGVDLVEEEGRARLPSPQELQGKIILKGSFKRDEVGISAVLHGGRGGGEAVRPKKTERRER